MSVETPVAESVKPELKEGEQIVIQPFTVSRNGIEGEFVQNKITRGGQKDAYYPAPIIGEANVDEWYQWIGKQAVAGILNSFVKRIAQVWNKNATNKATGEFSLETFKKHAASFSVIGETMKVLNERLRSLQAELSKVDIAKIVSLPDEAPEKKGFVELAQRVQSVMNAIENKRRDSAEADDEKEEKEAEPVSSV